MSKFYLFIFSILIFINTSFGQAPRINSFTPIKAQIGATITITGSNFSTLLTANTVYFGGVQATVLSATSTNLQVTVPVGAAFGAISVTVNNLSAYSKNWFSTTFGNGEAINTETFKAATIIANTHKPCFADFNGDGLVDMVGFIGSNKIAVFKNIGSTDKIEFATGVEFAASNGAQLMARDLDGDGKLDIILSNTSFSSVSIFRNTYAGASFSFAAPTYYSFINGDNVYSFDVADMDRDGKPDLIAGYVSSGRAFSIGKNTSTVGAISFAAGINVSYGSIPGGSGNVGNSGVVRVADIDGDNLPDVTVCSRFFKPFLVFRNTSTMQGSFTFAAKDIINSGRGTEIGNGFFDIKLADVDGDNKPEIGYVCLDSNFVSIYKNTSTVGLVAFDNRVDFPVSYANKTLAFNDVDGDGKTDVVTLAADSVNVLKNNTAIGGNFLFQATEKFKIDYATQTIDAIDIDLDGIPDIIVGGSDVNQNNRNSTYVLRNSVYAPTINSVIPITASQGTPITIKGKRFTGVTLVGFGNTNATSFTIVSDSVITAILGNGASGHVQVSNSNATSKFPGFTYSAPIPIITAVIPFSGQVGSSVLIKGKNFNPNATENIVRFGAAKVYIESGTDSTIVVRVPVNTSPLPISVTNAISNLMAYSHQPFITTFESNIAAFSNNQFGDTVNYATFSNPIKIATADFDNDSKTDIVASVYFNTNRASVFKNLGVANAVQFNPAKDYNTYTGTFNINNGAGITNTIAVDIDGDGMPDMASICDIPDWLAIHLNTGYIDRINFDSTKVFYTGANPSSVSAADFDNDGKTDLATTNSSSGNISVFKNLSTVGNIQFKEKTDYTSGSAPQDAQLYDFDNDGKVDIAAINLNNNNFVVLRNTSTTGSISFANTITFPTGISPVRIMAADFNNDNKIDIVVANNQTKNISVFKNTSTPGIINFDAKVDYAIPDFPRGITAADLDGDGKIDIAVGNTGSTANISLFKNNSTADSIKFLPKVDISKTNTPTDVFATDVNNDGVLDLIVSNSSKKITILKNKIGQPQITPICINQDSIVFTTNLIGAQYQWQQSPDSNFTNITNNSNYAGTNTNKLVIKNIPSNWYNYQYRCVVDGNYSQVRTLKVEAKWIGGVSNNWEDAANWSCGQLPDPNSDVIITAGNVFINSNVSVRSVRVSGTGILTVVTGFNLTTVF
jgi:large repetitive protein